MSRLLKTCATLVLILFILPTFAWTTVTVQKGQTIDSIAEKYRPNGVAEMDMVIALRSVNPGLGRALKTGTKLRVPTTVKEVREAITGQKSHTTETAAPAAKSVPVVKPAVAPAPKPAPKPVSKPAPKPAPKPVVKAVGPSNAQVTGYQASIKNLQQAIANQNQTIQTYQNQVADLTKQLNDANSTSSLVKSNSFLSFADLWFVLWLITSFLLWRSYQKNKNKDEKNESIVAEPNLQAAMVANASSIAGSVPKTDKAADDRLEPSLTTAHDEEAWRQVELDIPAADAPTQTNIRLEPSFSFEEQAELAGEQQHIIDAIASDHDNIEWHMALLEFYVKTRNQGGFGRHMQTMIRTGLMSEGDTLWEKIRKMYLNGWIYNGEA